MAVEQRINTVTGNDQTAPFRVSGELCSVAVTQASGYAWGSATVEVEVSFESAGEFWYSLDPAITLSSSRSVAQFGCAGCIWIRLRGTAGDSGADPAAEYQVLFR